MPLGMLVTPADGERYDDDGGQGGGKATAGLAATRHELGIIFDVIGTPPWAAVEAVPLSAWRNYLRGVPGR